VINHPETVRGTMPPEQISPATSDEERTSG